MEKSLIAVASIIEDNGKVLLVKEAKGAAKDKWNQPAGRLEVGESLMNGALRETKEETGYNVELTGIIGIYDELHEPRKRIRLVFLAKLKSKKQDSYSDDISKVKWFDRKALKELPVGSLASEGTHKSIQDYLSGKSHPLSLLRT